MQRKNTVQKNTKNLLKQSRKFEENMDEKNHVLKEFKKNILKRVKSY